ncbi:MAG: hypothetical protein ACLP4V_15650 [Methylocella sp.]
MKISSTSLLNEKSRGLLQNLAYLTKDPIFLAQARELLGDIFMRTFDQIGLLALSPSPAQRRFRYFEIIRNLLKSPPAGHGQPYGFPLELIRGPPLFVPLMLAGTSDAKTVWRADRQC